MEYLLLVLLVNARDTPGRLNVVRLGLALTRRAETRRKRPRDHG